MSERWATFDCYGTIVDWSGGVQQELSRLFGAESATRLLRRYHEVEPEIQRKQPDATYRDVLTMDLERLALEEGRELPPEEVGALANSLPWWQVFADAPGALLEAQDHGWKLAILSNTDRDLLDASMEAIGVPFDGSIVASEIGSYKPGTRHWEVFAESLGRDAEAHVHVAQSLFHDIAPTFELGIPSIWINRLNEPADPRPRVTLRSLTGLADALDSPFPFPKVWPSEDLQPARPQHGPRQHHQQLPVVRVDVLGLSRDAFGRRVFGHRWHVHAPVRRLRNLLRDLRRPEQAQDLDGGVERSFVDLLRPGRGCLSGSAGGVASVTWATLDMGVHRFGPRRGGRWKSARRRLVDDGHPSCP